METEALLLAFFLGAVVFCSVLFFLISAPLHELSHLCVAKLCDVTVKEVSLLHFSWCSFGHIVADPKSFKKVSYVYFVFFAGGIGAGTVFLSLFAVCSFVFPERPGLGWKELYSAILLALHANGVAQIVGAVVEGVFMSRPLIRVLNSTSPKMSSETD